MRIQVTVEGATWAEVRDQLRRILEDPAGSMAAVHVAAPPSQGAPTALPFDKPAMVVADPNAPQCPEHHQGLRLKPAGTNRQGAAYAAGYRCPVAGCRTFVPVVMGVAS